MHVVMDTGEETDVAPGDALDPPGTMRGSSVRGRTPAST